MSNWKKIGLAVACVVVIVVIAVAIWIWQTVETSRNEVAEDTVALADYHADDPVAVNRGEYVMQAADCAACHTKKGKGAFAGGHDFHTPFGVLLSSNITPDRDTGIGNMTERQFFNAVRNGQGSKGLLYPAMPFTSYAKLTDRDMHDLWAYMSTVKPVENAVDENGGMAFPYNMRAAMLGWDMLYFDHSAFKGDAEGADRGRYLVDAGGHCSSCHTPRNENGALRDDAYLQGAKLGNWYAPEITSDPHYGIGTDSAGDIAAYLGTGTNGHAMAAGPMAEAVENSLQYLTRDDRLAMAKYLKSVPASGRPAPAKLASADPRMTRGALDFEVNCSACHGVKGEGMGDLVPALDGNHALVADNPVNPIRAMLKGVRAASTHARPTGGGMPSFAWKMDDQQIADVLTYVRNAWSNSGKPVEPEDVAKLRAGLKAREKIAAGY